MPFCFLFLFPPSSSMRPRISAFNILFLTHTICRRSIEPTIFFRGNIEMKKREKKKIKIKNGLTVIFAWISYFLPFFEMNRHVSSSTLALTIWKSSWLLLNSRSSVFISCFKLLRQAIAFRDRNFFLTIKRTLESNSWWIVERETLGVDFALTLLNFRDLATIFLLKDFSLNGYLASIRGVNTFSASTLQCFKPFDDKCVFAIWIFFLIYLNKVFFSKLL